MAAHSVKMLVEHPLNIGSLGVEFEVRKGGKLLGKLQISQTSIDWTPAKARNPRKAGWQEFGDWMEGKGTRRDGPARAAVVVAPAGVGGDSDSMLEAASTASPASPDTDDAEPTVVNEPGAPNEDQWEGRF